MTQRSSLLHEGNAAQADKGASAYTPFTLALYDSYVLNFSNSFVWQCPSNVILDLYNDHISAKHLDIGVGTGYFLDRCHFPSTPPKIALLDLNPNSLEKTAKRLYRYSPSCHVGNALGPIDIGMSGFDSVGVNYLLHCLPGDLRGKSVVFENVKVLLNDGGTMFGATILGQGVRHNFLARKLLSVYNAKGIFCNLSDEPQQLENVLKESFASYSMHIVGCVALFSATK